LTTTYGRSTVSSSLPLHLRENKNVHYEGSVPWMLIPEDTSPPVTRNVATDVRLNLFTRSNPTTAYRLLVNNNNNLANSAFNRQNPTKILIHGFTGNAQDRLLIRGRNEYLARGNYNIISVDWAVLAAGPNYNAAVRNTRPVGQHIADLIEFLVRVGNARLVDFHLIGHSLGAHVAGFAGSSIRTGRVARITGLDSANPQFNNVGPDGRLDPSDAVLVDTIHTDADRLGLREPHGHVSFYPNGGTRVQPGCSWITDNFNGLCSHSRCVDFFVHSIRNNNAFPARRCLTLNGALTESCVGTSTAFMGDRIRFDTTGIYTVNTRNVNVRL